MAITAIYRQKLLAMTDAELLAETAKRINWYADSEKSMDRITGPEAMYFECFWTCCDRGLRESFDRLKAEIMAQRRRESEMQWERIHSLGKSKKSTN